MKPLSKKEIERKIQQVVAVLRRYGVTEAYLFGSAQEGNFGLASDLDLAVIGLPPSQYYKAVGEVLEVAGIPVDIVTMEDGSSLSEYLKKKRDRGDLRRVA